MYEKSLGGLWKNQNRSHPKSPNYLGSLKLKRKELKALLEIAEVYGEAKINLAGWKNQKGPDVFVTLEGQAPKALIRSASPAPSLENFSGDEDDFL